jgi:hypothetical protein
LRDSSTDPRVRQFFNRVMTKEEVWVKPILIIFV